MYTQANHLRITGLRFPVSATHSLMVNREELFSWRLQKSNERYDFLSNESNIWTLCWDTHAFTMQHTAGTSLRAQNTAAHTKMYQHLHS